MAKFTKLNIGDSVASGGGRVFKKLSMVTIPTEQLPAPYGVSLDGDYLTWGDYSILATSFDILVDGVVKATVSAPTNSFDLSTLGLADGTYSISVVSKADGYWDSEPSEAVTYTVGGDDLAGTWVLNNVIKPYNETFTPIDTNWLLSGSFPSGLGTFSAYNGSSVVSDDIYNFMIYTVSGAADNITIFNINSYPSSYPYVTYTRNQADIYLGKGSSNHTRVVRSDYDGQYTITFNDNVNSISSEKYSLILEWFKANATKQ